MDVGILAPQVGFNSGPIAMRDVAQAAEQMGFASVWTTDHLIVPAKYSSDYPYSDDKRLGVEGEQPYYELLTTLGYLSAVTERVKLGVAVSIVPYRHPVYLSKAISSLDQLSKGRFIFGAGVGWLKEEFDALDLDFHKRGRYTDEALEFLRASWSADQPVSFDGEHIHLEPSYFAPRPYEGRRVPFWIGGHSEIALRRVANHGDAWFPHLYGSSPDVLRQKMERINELRHENGEASEVELALFLPITINEHPSGERAKPWESRKLDGTLDEIRSALLDYREVGVTHVLLMFGGKVDQRIDWMSRLRDEVLVAL